MPFTSLVQDVDGRPSLLEAQAASPTLDHGGSSMEDVARPAIAGSEARADVERPRAKPADVVVRLGEPGVVELRGDVLEEGDEPGRGERAGPFRLDAA